ncbi:MAG: family 16 glycoside hydrolase [Planctomycetota bacterium]
MMEKLATGSTVPVTSREIAAARRRRGPLGRWTMLGGLLISSGFIACQPAAAPPNATSPPAAESDKPTSESTSKMPAKSPLAESPKGDASDENQSGAASPAAPFTPPLSAAELADGWISLFDGKTLFGWQAASKANWRVEDGAITVSEGEPGLLCSGVPWSDYELRLEFRFASGTNSGVFLHTPAKPTDPKLDCYELNIAEPAVSPFPTGSFVGREKGTDAAGKAQPDTWHEYEIRVEGGRVAVKLDGQSALEYVDTKPLRRGLIGLQLNKGAVAFRQIRLKPLGLATLFNGRDLDGWSQPASSKSRVTVTPDGELSLKDGKGYLESKERFGDFVARLECKTLARSLNSGLFFRCIPGEEMNGYESQIHNGYKAGDRGQPADCGTGGIFRRVNARLVAADDLEWFTKTLNVAGPTVAVWVNGYQVTQWTDERAVDANPRKGLRLEAGTLQLQGHDPTTDLLFRQLQAAESSPRPAQ